MSEGMTSQTCYRLKLPCVGHIVLPRTYQVRIILDTVYVDLVDARNRHAHRCTHSEDGKAACTPCRAPHTRCPGGSLSCPRQSIVPFHPECRWTPSTNSRPSGNGKHGRVLFDDILLASDIDHHAHHLVRHLVVLCLHVASIVAIHLVARPRLVRETSGRIFLKWLLDERRVRASKAERCRQVMGPNAKVVKNARDHWKTHQNLCVCFC